MNTIQLEVFLAVADTLSFARAAERMNITQPAVTGQIHNLENELGTRLFKRSTRSVEMTESGLVFLNEARSIVDTARRAVAMFSNQNPEVREVFRIGTHLGHEARILASPLEKLRKEFPDTIPMINSVPMPFMHIYKQLADENIDIVLSFKEELVKANLEYRELSRVELAAVMRKDNPLARKKTVNPSQLEESTLILSNPRSCPTTLDRLQHRLCAGQNPSRFLMCSSIDAACTLVRAGYGIALMPDIKETRWNDLAYRKIDCDEALSFGIYMQKIAPRPVLSRFVEILEETFSPS